MKYLYNENGTIKAYDEKQENKELISFHEWKKLEANLKLSSKDYDIESFDYGPNIIIKDGEYKRCDDDYCFYYEKVNK